MRKALAVAELYKLIYGETDPQKKEMYQEMLEQKKKDVLKEQKDKDKKIKKGCVSYQIKHSHQSRVIVINVKKIFINMVTISH